MEIQFLKTFRHVNIEAVLRLVFLPKENGRPIYITSNMITSYNYTIRPERAKVLLEKYMFL